MKELITRFKTDIEVLSSFIRKPNEAAVENIDFEINEGDITFNSEIIDAGMKNGHSLKISKKMQGLQGLKQSWSAAALGNHIARLV